MGGMMQSFSVGCTTTDTDSWDTKELLAAEIAGVDNYHDWIVGKLRDELQKTADAFVAEHPSVFACEVVI